MKLAILNTSILTAEGTFSLRTITTEQAIELANANNRNLLSAVGHESTAQILTTIFGLAIPVNRIQFTQPLELGVTQYCEK